MCRAASTTPNFQAPKKVGTSEQTAILLSCILWQSRLDNNCIKAAVKIYTCEYQILAILFVDGDHSTLYSTFFAGLFDVDVCDVRKVT